MNAIEKMTKIANNTKINNIGEIVGGGYKKFWECTTRYRVCKGSRASKKSKTTALNLIYRLMQYPKSNILVVRKVYSTLKDSCYTDLKWAINLLGLEKDFDCRTSPIEIIYKPTKQKILFRGLDDPFKITSITVEVGHLCWLWLEEAYEVTREQDFDILDESIRGEVPAPLFKQITITFNPWNERHWLKRRFFDYKNDDILAITTNYKCNEFLDDTDLALFERMKEINPRRYQVAGLGNWGTAEGLIYENWEEQPFNIDEVKGKYKNCYGLDFGYTNDPTAFVAMAIDTATKQLWIYDEIYQVKMSNTDIANALKAKGYAGETIIADCAEPKSIDDLKHRLGIRHIKPCVKGKDSIMNGITNIQDYKIWIHPKCINVITEISNYGWRTNRQGEKVNEPMDDFNHAMDAMRYGIQIAIKSKIAQIIRKPWGL